MVIEISKITGIPAEAILGRSRTPNVVCARQLYWKLLREKKRFTLREIGEMNDRDASTIQQGIKHAEDLLDTGDKISCSLWEKIKTVS